MSQRTEFVVWALVRGCAYLVTLRHVDVQGHNHGEIHFIGFKSLLSIVLVILRMVIDGMRRMKPAPGRQSPALHPIMARDLLYASSHTHGHTYHGTTGRNGT